MKVSPIIVTLAAAALVPAGVALAATGPTAAPPAPVVVANYTFNGPVSPAGYISEQSGRGMALRVRAADGGTLRFIPRSTGKAVAFPARCATTAPTCARVILEGGDDADLDPGTRPFQYGAWIRTTLAQAGPSGNVVQKGVATAESQWKMQVGGRAGRATCVLVGQGSTQRFIAKSSNTVTDNAWHRVICRRSATALTVFVDGVARGTVAVPAGLSVANTKPLRIAGQNLTDRTESYGGALDDVVVTLL
jgi:hypothetical protein